MILKVILILLGIVILIGIIIFIYKIYQLNQLGNMSSNDMIKYVTKDDDNTKISVAIIKDGEIDYKTYGKDGKQEDYTKYDYEIGSISKTFVSLILSKAISENKISITDSISKYLDIDKDKYYPTIERLITHTSGYKSYYFDKQMINNQFSEDNDFYGISKENILNSVKNIDLENKDYKFKYSNFGISVIGLVLEKVYNKDFVTLMNEFIVNDLNLENTKVATCNGNLKGYWNWKQDDGYIPAGAIISNIEDMAKYLDLYMASNTDYINNTSKEFKAINSNNFMYEKMNINMDKIGMAWIIDTKNNIIWHNGGTSNFNSYIAFNKKKKIGVVILSNISPSKKIPMTAIGAKIMTELSHKS
ncbi:serine hydrolase domain-containing protein [Clostridium sp. AL.422]|uniref:serine hydrolase domain-containing protein n=1 Tax=Clostridium TaxID=1485 RepID=UPI00293E0024|nr:MULTISPECIES: serine hydrolase domain-containing protein [unclassified Clostridium]MDV4152282.1 serine hydrolase domain-containing protein [Clostridium sp. AL.422]